MKWRGEELEIKKSLAAVVGAVFKRTCKCVEKEELIRSDWSPGNKGARGVRTDLAGQLSV